MEVTVDRQASRPVYGCVEKDTLNR
jgi:hypothetical protein